MPEQKAKAQVLLIEALLNTHKDPSQRTNPLNAAKIFTLVNLVALILENKDWSLAREILEGDSFISQQMWFVSRMQLKEFLKMSLNDSTCLMA